MKELIEDIKLRRVVNNLLNNACVSKSHVLDMYSTSEYIVVFMRVYHQQKLVRVNNRALRDEFNITFDDRIHKIFSDFLNLDISYQYESYDPYTIA